MPPAPAFSQIGNSLKLELIIAPFPTATGTSEPFFVPDLGVINRIGEGLSFHSSTQIDRDLMGQVRSSI
ncbi:MAG: hypothetical protein SWY16_10700 [Cyanobacteriota bacterium]|nr:hypothetical protein [Cyanobacteriota bacterium]